MSTTLWLTFSLLTISIAFASDDHFTITSHKVHVMAMGAASSQQSFVILMDTLSYAKIGLSDLTIPPTSSTAPHSQHLFDCTLKIPHDTKVLKAIESIDKLGDNLEKTITWSIPIGIFSITTGNVDYWAVNFESNGIIYQVFSRIDGAVSDKIKFAKLDWFKSYSTVISSSTPSVVYVHLSENGCLNRIEYKDDQLNKAQDVTLETFLDEIGTGFSAKMGLNSFLNNAPSLNVVETNAVICIKTPTVISGGYYNDSADLLITFSNENEGKLYIFRNVKDQSASSPLEPTLTLDWSEFLICPEGGSLELPPDFRSGIYKISQNSGRQSFFLTNWFWLGSGGLVILIVVIILMVIWTRMCSKKSKKTTSTKAAKTKIGKLAKKLKKKLRTRSSSSNKCTSVSSGSAIH